MVEQPNVEHKTTAWYEMKPSQVERLKGPTKHRPIENSVDWVAEWIAGFTTQQGKLLKLLMDYRRAGDAGPFAEEWIVFLTTELASWLELLVDKVPGYYVNDVEDAIRVWAKRHSTLPPLSPALARLMAFMRDERWKAANERQGS